MGGSVYPVASDLPCIVQGTSYQETVQGKIPASKDTTIVIPVTIDIDSVEIDSILGMPTGITFGRSPARVPGGGYGCVAQANEGIPLAQWFNAHGVSAAVLTYRIAPDYHYPAPLEDGRRAVQWVRRHAAELNAQPDHVGLLGFSAGGHLAAFTAATAFDPLPAGWLNPPDFAGASSRPDFLALGYPVITMKERTHGGSRTNLLGLAADDKAMQEQLSVETRITGDMPPSFLFSTTDDPSVPIANSIDFYQSMVLAGAPVEMHLYEHGRHGLGLAEESVEVSTWPSLLANWMAMHKWMAIAPIDTSPKSPGTATSSPAGTSPLRTNE